MSTSTARSGAVRTRKASPWPTSHITTRQSVAAPALPRPGTAAGRRGPAQSTTSTSAVHPAEAVIASRHRPGRASRRTSGGPLTTTRARTTASTSPPRPSAGQGTAPWGTAAPARAIHPITCAGAAATQAMASARGSATGCTSTTTTPPTVAGATSGAAARLVSRPTTLTCPCSIATTGAVVSAAATGITNAWATGSGTAGQRRRSASAQGRTKSTRPSVASTESANP